MVGLGLVSSLLFVPDIRQKEKLEVVSLEAKDNWTILTLQAVVKFNPGRIFWPLIYPNVLLAVSLPPMQFSHPGPSSPSPRLEPTVYLQDFYGRI